MPAGPMVFVPYPNWANLTPANSNCTYGIQWIWVFMGQCVMDTRGMVAMVCGFICLAAWIINGVPQMVENFRTGIPDQAMSPFLLLFWTLGDVSSLIGCILTHQLVLQTVISIYSIASDLILAAQFFYYKLRHQIILSRVSEALGDGRVNPVDDSSDFISDDSDVSSRVPLLQDEPSMITSNSNTNRRRLFALSAVFLGLFGLQTYNGGSSPLSSLDTSKNSRPIRGFASRHLLKWSSTEQIPIAVATSTSWRHSFMRQPFLPETSAKIGYILGFLSSVMYVSSRFPQILRNWQRGSTEGLCVILFCLALVGNASYGLQIFLTSLDPRFLLNSLPWLIGSVGVLLLDLIATLDKREACENWRAKDRLKSSLLAIFPCALVGKSVTVTLLDETRVTGRLSSCDGMMNLVLGGGVHIRRLLPSGSEECVQVEEITIFGKRVRYVTLPDGVDVRGALEQWDFETVSSGPTLSLSKRLLTRPKRARDKYEELRTHPPTTIRTDSIIEQMKENQNNAVTSSTISQVDGKQIRLTVKDSHSATHLSVRPLQTIQHKETFMGNG
ncbi:hypothetical protein PHET_02736 [Paragonimus heterotremus]|uniref:Sm domain-containing protein n=1 Tax=Paragonimus heterotremus TaxID=100268 RepID=A0A8J4T3Y4_9TREM|nr:hypothetical protein PHET_02736 [Paragonimus heterotremus]